MKHFAIAALAAAPAFAQWQWIDWPITEDGSAVTKHFMTYPTSKGSISGSTLTIDNNSSMFMKDTMDDTVDAVYKPGIRGGSIKYDVDVSSVDCGCVAGVYLVKTSAECGQDSMDNENPMCPSIEIMEANKWGFNVSAHPCASGVCDAASQCEYKMKTDGAAKYGPDAYGPGGSLINTFNSFNVKTEFVSDADYVTLWKLRTTLTQGGDEIVMEADCGDEYLNALTNSIEGEMGFIFSSWDNSAGVIDVAPTCDISASCDDARTVVSNFAVSQWGSAEDRVVDPIDPIDPVDPVDPATLIEGGLADYVSLCGEGCTSCIETWWDNAVEDIIYKCVDETLYRYANRCGGNKDLSLCGVEDYCHMSWPHGDPDKARSADAACRPVPDEWIWNEFTYSNNPARKQNKGLCVYGCDGAICHNSWFPTDAEKWKGASAMLRCKYE